MSTIEMLTQQILTHHLTAFGSNDLNEIMKDYSEESEVLTPAGPLKGLTAISGFLKRFLKQSPQGLPLK